MILCNGYGLVERGSERFTKELYDHLKDEFNVEIYGIRSTNESTGMNTRFREYFWFIPWRNGKAYAESYFVCKKWYKLGKHSFDLVINNAGIGGSYWCKKYRKKTGTPFITLERGGGKEEIINYLFKPNCMMFFTVVSERMVKKSWLPKVPTKVIPIGIDPDEYTNPKKSKLIDGLERPIFLSTSAMIKFKRIDLIIKAIHKLGKGSLVQTSEGNLASELVEMGVKLLGCSRFRYVGIVTREELLSLYHSCDVFVNASKSEAFGIVYLEAMASGLPIVTQLDSRRKENFGVGMFVDCEQIDNFANSLEKAYTATDKKQILEHAKKFSWDNLIPEYKEMIEEVVG